MAHLTKSKLNAIGIHNPHNLASRGAEPQVYVDYFPSVTGRAAKFARWSIGRIGYKTDPKGHWSEGYNKTFTVTCRADKEPQRIKAIEWATERYKIKEWERSPFGSYHPTGTLAKVEAGIRKEEP
jgi:hypothetical protein